MTKPEAIAQAYKALRGHYPTQLRFHWKGVKITRQDFNNYEKSIF